MTLKNTKAKGNRNEHRSRRLLEAMGYAVTRSAASLGEWDLIGLGCQDVILCQVRTRDWPGPLERAALTEFQPCPPNTRKILHRWRDGQRVPDVWDLTIMGFNNYVHGQGERITRNDSR